MKVVVRKVACRVFAVSLWLLAGAVSAAQLPVLAGFSIVGDVAKAVGGSKVAVTNLIEAGQDAHAYHLTGSGVRKIRAAKLVLLNGLGFEPADVQRAVRQSKVPYVEAAAGIAPIEADHSHSHHGHDHGEFDPHVWHDPVLMQTYAANVAAALVKADPANRDYYQGRLKSYIAELKQLDIYARSRFNRIPAGKRRVLTGHEAFAYLGKRYGIRFYAPQGAGEAQPSARQVAALIRSLRQNRVKAVFGEYGKDMRMIEQIARGSGVKLGGRLHADTLGSSTEADTYIKMFRHNIDVLADAMQ
ncbi:metal ABC transporter solute-binding protein, Zn/Mn family [Neisseria leonii]|uniref:metal ABC transporter solute-binding protein, Zn/Mn family n=1 Tax=Neisseria leonii TaxID=2995413 RepID=UPI00237ABA2F|nr:zinc ABC transporter substrate-binding protein [Neisseria sp. 3986]MDD9324885.1 zinc ABC transporter substrate-binding protein [Neisseria sp. 3986]